MNKTTRSLWLRVLSLVLVALLLPVMNLTVLADDAATVAETTKVAKVGNVEYATIDEAIANWTNGTTLTLLADVTLSDVITFKSTEHHILNLGTYTMTAASGKHAIEITCDGRSSASYALTVNADAKNPGGITASGMSCIYYKKSGSTKDRPIILINNGVFTGSYSLNITSNGNTNCPQIWINGGTFNSYMNLTKCMLKVSGGTFHAAINCTGDQNAYRQISGGRFKSWQFMTADKSNKFALTTNFQKDGNGNWIGNYDVGVYVDKEGYLVVGGPVITELSDKYPAVASNYSKWSSYLKYSSAATYGLFYEDADMAIKKHGEANVTIYEKPAITIPENVTGDATVVEEIKNNTALKGYAPEIPENVEELVIELKSVEEKIVYDVTPIAEGIKVEPTAAITFRLPIPASVTDTYAKVYHDGETEAMGYYKIQGEGDAKYIEISTDDFSEFAVETVTPTKGYYLTIYNADGSVGMNIDGTMSIDDFCLRSAIEDARAFANNGFFFGISGPATFVVEMFEDSIEDKSFTIGADVTVNGNGHKIVLGSGVTLTNNGTFNDVIVEEPVYAACIGNVGYATLAEAFAALTEGDTLVIFAGEYSEGAIKLPATLKNVTIKGENGAILKDMTISAADDNSVVYEGLTFDGIVFDNSNIVLTGWRTGEVSYKDITVTNCTFKNIVRTSNEAAIHINCNATEAVYNFTFTNNVIDGVSGASNSGIYLQATGEIVVENNVINNVAFRPYVIQLTVDDGIADEFTVTGNTFSGSAAGRAQGLGNNAAGTDEVDIVVSNNIFKDITSSQQICYWNFNADTTTAELSGNYYDIDIIANPNKVYFNSAAQDVMDLVDMGIFPIYTELNANGTINTESAFNPADDPAFGKVAQIGDQYFDTLAEAFAAVTSDDQTVIILADVTENLAGAYLRGNIVGNATITLTNSDWVSCPYTFVIGEGITLNVPALFYYAGGSVIRGTVVAGAYYQRYAGKKLTIEAPGSMTVTSETCIIRYMDNDPNAGIYIVGDNDDSTVELKLAVAYFYQGMINAKDATIVCGTYWQTNETDGQGSANLVLDNSKLTVSVYDHPAKATGNSTVTLKNGSTMDCRNGGFTYGDNAVISIDSTSSIIGKNGEEVQIPVAQIGDVKFETLADALLAAQNGDTIVLLADVTLDRAVTLTDIALTITGDYTLNANDLLTLAGTVSLNAPKLTGDVAAAGNAVIKDTNIGGYLYLNASDSTLTFQGDNKVNGFSASYYNNVITIGEGAYLEITGSQRLTIGWGNTFNITGTVEDAKTADKSAIKPSLKVAAGITVNGSSALTTFNVTNAYIVLSSTCGTNKNATGKFVISFTNSIADLSMFKQQYAYGTYDVDFIDSVINVGANLVFLSPDAVVDVNNSNITVNSSFGNAGKFTLSNGSVMTVKSMLESTENGYNSGLTIVDNATLNVTGGVYSGYNTGKLQVVNGGVANINKIVKSTIELDADSTVNVTTIDATSSIILGAGASMVAPEGLTVTTAEGWEVKYENGAFISVQPKVYVAEINGVKFESLADAVEYAKAEGITDLVITLVGETTRDSAAALEDAFNLLYTTAFDSVTIKQEDNTTPYYIDCIYTGSRNNGGEFIFDGVNIVVVEQYMFEGNVKLINNSVVTSVAEANCFFYSCWVTVEPGSMIKGVIEDFRSGHAVIDGGRTDGQYNDQPSLQDAILIINWSGDSLVIKNGAYVKANQVNEVGRITINGGAYIEVLDSKLEALEYITVNGELRLNTESVVTTGKITGNGNIIIDATNLEGRVTVIESKDLASFTGTITITGNEFAKYEITENGLEIVYVEPVAQIGDVKYGTLDEAIEAAVAGDEIVLLKDITITADTTLPAGITLNGNGKSITGATVWAEGNLTFVGHTKMTLFNAGYNKPVITIGEGACLELTGTVRMVLGHGATFNITGTIADAKTADVAELTPSLIAAGASFTGAGLNFNVTNAYVKFTAYCSSKNSSANGTFNFNVTNSIWNQTGSLTFSEPTNGKDPTFNFSLEDSVLNSTSHLVFAVTKGEIVIDNSNVNVGSYKQLENRSNMTIKNGSVVYAAFATSSNAKNPGTLTVDNATLISSGEFSGADVGIGTLNVKNNANVTVGKISKANVTVDVTSLLTVTNNIAADTTSVKVDATAFDGEDVLVIKSANLANYTAIELVGCDTAALVLDANGVTVVYVAPELWDIQYTNVYLTENFTMAFAFATDFEESWDGYYAVITKGDDDANTLVVPYSEWDIVSINAANDHFAIYYKGIVAKEMNEVVTITIFDADGNQVSNTESESIKSYAMGMFDYTTDAKLKTLAVDILNYGAEAQLYFNYSIDTLANSELTDEHQACASAAREYEEIGDTSCADGYAFNFFTNVVLDNNIQIMFAFKNLNSVEFSEDAKIVISYNDHDGNLVKNELAISDAQIEGPFIIVTVDSFSALDSSALVTCELVEGETVIASVSDSVEGYVARITDESMIKVGTAMMKYCDSAYAYFYGTK